MVGPIFKSSFLKPSKPEASTAASPFRFRDVLAPDETERRTSALLRLEIGARERIVVGNYGSHVWALLVRNGPDGAPLPQPLVFLEVGSQHGQLSLLDIKDPKNKGFPISWNNSVDSNFSYDRDEASRKMTAIHITHEAISKYGIPINPGRPLQLEVAETMKG